MPIYLRLTVFTKRVEIATHQNVLLQNWIKRSFNKFLEFALLWYIYNELYPLGFMINTQEFYTIEELQDFLQKQTGFNPPSIIEGREGFFGKFSKWFSNFNDNDASTRNWKCIFPNPSFGLAYPYPIDEIYVALSLTSHQARKAAAQEILNKYELSESISKRQTITLSGGEILLLNFAKAHTLLEITDTIFICTPTQWLNSTKYYLLYDLVQQYDNAGKKVFLLLMEGENFTLNNRDHFKFSHKQHTKKASAIPWTLELNNLTIEFPGLTFPKDVPSHKIFYKPLYNISELLSPTLLIGNNGVGKSVLVKLLAGIFTPTEGQVKVRCLGNEGNARILMQDSLDQLFGETVDDHFNRIYKYDKERGKKARELYNLMLEKLQIKVKDNPELRNKKLFAHDDKSIDTILQAKFALTAERIESHPPLLILDEPDWSLSKSVTKLFVDIINEIAYENQIPILIITHLNDWYSELTESILEFKRNELDESIEIYKIK